MAADSGAPARPAEATCEFFVRMWAEEVQRQVTYVRDRREEHERDLQAAERGEDYSPLPESSTATFGSSGLRSTNWYGPLTSSNNGGLGSHGNAGRTRLRATRF